MHILGAIASPLFFIRPKTKPNLSLSTWGCTSILLKTPTGMVHGRNMDYLPRDALQKMTYIAIFSKGGKEIFRAIMFAGISDVLTAWKGLDKNSTRDVMSFSVNARHPASSTLGDIFDLLQIKKLLKSRENHLIGWLPRKALEEETEYDAVFQRLSTTKTASVI